MLNSILRQQPEPEGEGIDWGKVGQALLEAIMASAKWAWEFIKAGWMAATNEENRWEGFRVLYGEQLGQSLLCSVLLFAAIVVGGWLLLRRRKPKRRYIMAPAGTQVPAPPNPVPSRGGWGRGNSPPPPQPVPPPPAQPPAPAQQGWRTQANPQNNWPAFEAEVLNIFVQHKPALAQHRNRMRIGAPANNNYAGTIMIVFKTWQEQRQDGRKQVSVTMQSFMRLSLLRVSNGFVNFHDLDDVEEEVSVVRD